MNHSQQTVDNSALVLTTPAAFRLELASLRELIESDAMLSPGVGNRARNRWPQVPETEPANVCPRDDGRNVVPGSGRLRGLRLLREALDD